MRVGRELQRVVAVGVCVVLALFMAMRGGARSRVARESRPSVACATLVVSDCTQDAFCVPVLSADDGASLWSEEFVQRLHKAVGWEPLTGRMLNALVLELAPNSVVMQAGVHVGDDFVVMAKNQQLRRPELNLTWLGVDPDETKVAFVRSVVAANGIARASVLHGALGAHDGTTGALLRDSQAGGWSVAPQQGGEGGGARAEFDMFTVDAILKRLQRHHATPLRLGLLHLDVEGFEYSALVGAAKSLSVTGFAAVLYETAHGDEQKLIAPLLERAGYTLRWTAEHNALYTRTTGPDFKAQHLPTTAPPRARARVRRAPPQSKRTRRAPADDDDDDADDDDTVTVRPKKRLRSGPGLKQTADGYDD